ncbi:MAG: protein kinase [SAR324 cluster bacterium]|nr:protein kinase [SAR324 cluster bacterium]
MWTHSSLIGQLLVKRYEIRKLLGEGGMGQVFLVWDRQTREEKAVKLVDVRKKRIPMEAILRFKTEAETLKSLRHPNIIKYEDFFETDEIYGMVMEYEPSSSLTQYLQKFRTMPIRTVLTLFHQLADALAFIHEKGLVHHDLKSSNIILSEEDGTQTFKLLDFGFAKLLGSSEHMTEGTLIYMAPEQTGILQKNIDHRADLYSLGIVVYQALTGQVPFTSSDPAILVHQHIAQTPEKPTKLREETPKILEELVLKLLNKDPDDRYRTSNGLLKDLFQYQRIVDSYATLDASFDLGEQDHRDSFPQVNPFVGREEVLQNLENIINSTVHLKKGGVVFLEGIKGIGRTTVLSNFFNRLQCRPVGRSIFLSIRKEDFKLPYQLVIRLLNFVIFHLKSLPESEQHSFLLKVKTVFSYRFDLLLELVPQLRPWYDQEHKIELAKGKNWSSEDYEWLIVDLLRAISETMQHAIILIDDLHYVEPKSAQCLINCFERLAEIPVLLIFSYTHEELPRKYLKWIEHYEKEPFFHNLHLGPFQEKHYFDLLQKLFSKQLYDAPKLVVPLYQATQGNPAFLRKLLQDLVDSKLIFFEKQSWNTDLEASLKFIENYNTQLIFDPLRQWEPDDRAILQRGAVFHKAFTMEALISVSSSPPALEHVTESRAIKLLDNALRTGVLFLEAGRYYAFRDNQVRQNLLETLSLDLRRNIHRGIAQHLEEYALPIDPASIYNIAYHWEKAGDTVTAIRYNLKAARHTDDGLFHDRNAEIYYNLALNGLKQIPQDAIEPELQFEIRYNAIRHTLAQSQQFDRLWEETLELEIWVGDDSIKRIKLLYIKAFLSFMRGRKDKMFQYGHEALDLSVTEEEKKQVVGIYNILGRVASEKTFSERIELLCKGIEMAFQYQQFSEAPGSVVILSILLAYQARFKEAHQKIGQYTKILDDHQFPGDELRISALICLETERGNFNEVLALHKKMNYENRFVNPLIQLFYQGRVALAQGMLGYFKESLQSFEKFFNVSEQTADQVLQRDIILARIQVALRMEEPETALYYLDKAAAVSEKSGDPYLKAMLAIYAGFTHMALGQLDDAAHYLERQAKALADRIDSILLNIHLKFALAKLHWLQTKDTQFLKEANQILVEMHEHEITGFYEIYKDDLKNWATFFSDSSSQLSTFLSGNLQMTQLMEINREITATLEVESLLDYVLKGAMTIVGAEHGYLFTYDNDFDSSNPNLLPALRLTRNAEGELIPVNQYVFSKSVVRTVMDTKKTIITRDARNEKEWNLEHSVNHHTLRSILATPILLQKQIKGILYLDNHHASSVFSFKDREIVDMFATQVAIALNNAQIYEQEQEAHRKTEATLRTFERFIPRQFTDRFAEGNIENLKTGLSQKETLSILFSDIRNFTSFTESMSPDDIFKFLNSYLLRMEAPIRKHEGFVDKFIGDGIMALFEQSPKDAVMAGIEMLATLEDYNIHRNKKGKVPVRCGIGINTGEVMLGVVGSNQRTDTTVLGDAVNTASRVEALTKYYGATFLITGETYNYVHGMKNLFVRLIDEVQVKGREKGTQIYEIFNDAADPVKEKILKQYPLFHQAFQVYQQGDWNSCSKLFAEYADCIPEDKVADRFIERCQFFTQLPPENWTGIYRIENK